MSSPVSVSPDWSSGGLRKYIRTRWPFFAAVYGGLVLALILIGLGFYLEWYAFVPFALAISLVCGYFLVSSIWVGHQLYGVDGQTPLDSLLQLGQILPDEKIACIDLGLRTTPIILAQHLTVGKIVVIDVYNPQANPGSVLRRARTLAPRPVFDPRLEWIDGNIELLPLPNSSVSAVYLNGILAEFWLQEDRERLMREVWRILIPKGRLLIAERARTQTNLVMTGLLTFNWLTVVDWHSLIVKSGFTLQREQIQHHLLYSARATKPPPGVGRQMKLNLGSG